MAPEGNFYTRFIDGDNYVFMDTVHSTGTNDYEIVLPGDGNVYTIKWDDYATLSVGDTRTRAVWRTRMEDVIRVHVHFNGTGPGDNVTQGQINEVCNAARRAAWGCLNVPPGVTQADKREMYKMTKMLLIRLVMMMRDFHAE